jgi:hypothetical protein
MNRTYTKHFREENCIQKFGWNTTSEADHWGGIGVTGRVILKWTLKKYDVKLWTEFIGLGLWKGQWLTLIVLTELLVPINHAASI